jgi:hypothetical protein
MKVEVGITPEINYRVGSTIAVLLRLWQQTQA